MADEFKPKKMGKASFVDILATMYTLVECPEPGCKAPALLFNEDSTLDGEEPVILCLVCWQAFNPETGVPLEPGEKPSDQKTEEGPGGKARR